MGKAFNTIEIDNRVNWQSHKGRSQIRREEDLREALSVLLVIGGDGNVGFEDRCKVIMATDLKECPCQSMMCFQTP